MRLMSRMMMLRLTGADGGKGAETEAPAAGTVTGTATGMRVAPAAGRAGGGSVPGLVSRRLGTAPSGCTRSTRPAEIMRYTILRIWNSFILLTPAIWRMLLRGLM